MVRMFDRYVGLTLLTIICGLTLATGYINYWIGGALLMLNAAGYAALAALVIGSATFYRRALPLVLLALAAYAAVTIVGWLVLGPYFDIAYLAKAIELALIGAIAIYLWLERRELRASLAWARSILSRVTPFTTLAVLASTLASCAGSPSATPVGTPAVTVEISASNSVFDRNQLTVVANAPFAVQLENQDSIPHNVSVRGAPVPMVGEVFTGPGERTYLFAALPAGTYNFVCDLHLEMNGTLLSI